jgi:hypothetical protein
VAESSRGADLGGGHFPSVWCCTGKSGWEPFDNLLDPEQREDSGPSSEPNVHRLTAILSLRHDLALCRVAQALARSRPGIDRNLQRLTLPVSLGCDLQDCRFAQRLARSSPQSSALTKLRHGPSASDQAVYRMPYPRRRRRKMNRIGTPSNPNSALRRFSRKRL